MLHCIQKRVRLLIKADSSINTVEDLQDKRVSVGEEESGTEQNAKQILAAYGLNDSLVDEDELLTIPIRRRT